MLGGVISLMAMSQPPFGNHKMDVGIVLNLFLPTGNPLDWAGQKIVLRQFCAAFLAFPSLFWGSPGALLNKVASKATDRRRKQGRTKGDEGLGKLGQK
jgi:hypothetical protein